jgi:uncharacterized lipoprotein YajG
VKAITAGLALVAAALLAGCTRSPQAKAKEAKAALASWQATRRLVDEQRARGVLPEQYVRQVIRAVEEGRAQALAQLREASAP